mgnify:CR=1 FL=1
MHDLSQEDLAQIIGVSRQTIHFIERNKYVPSTVLALKLARYFKVKVEELFELEDTD